MSIWSQGFRQQCRARIGRRVGFFKASAGALGPARRHAGPGAVRFIIASVVAGALWGAPASSAVTVGGPFALTASDGMPVTDQTYRGKWLLVYFGYTSCPDTCPTALVAIAAALVKLGPDAAVLQPLFITVDPQRDTSEVLRDYVRSFDPRIIGLTGSERQIEAVAGEYGAYFARRRTGPAVDDYVMDHSSYIYVMDPGGQFVRAFDTTASADDIAARLRDVLRRGQAPHAKP